MSVSSTEVVVTGIGIVSSLGTGRADHQALLAAETAPEPILETGALAPYLVHPLSEIDWSAQIPRRGDQRQMEKWQRLGVFAAGLALDDAGLKDDAEAKAAMDLVVAAGGGERDIAVDTLVVDAAGPSPDRAVVLNEKLASELRPTLFLAQLSNLLAGNISIVHKVTGSSRTAMGEEGAGVSAFETACARIRAGQSTHALVGASSAVERADIQILVEAVRGLTRERWTPIWARAHAPGGGIILGSAAAFLVVEARERAEARGARIYARIEAVGGDRGRREANGLEDRLTRLAADTGADRLEAPLVMSGASGLIDLAARERAWLARALPGAALRGYGGLLGHALEAQFPIGMALAALALEAGAPVPPFDPGREAAMSGPARHAVVTTIGHSSAEGIAVLSAEGART